MNTLPFAAGANPELVRNMQTILDFESTADGDPYRTADWLVLAKLIADNFADFEASEPYDALKNIADIWSNCEE